MICFNCGNSTTNKYPLCNRCKPVKIDRDNSCKRCGYPQSSFVEYCQNCQEILIQNRSLFLYRGIAKDILQLYKFNKKYSLARLFSEEILKILEFEDVILSPVPTSFVKKRLKSGYHLDPIIEFLKKSEKVEVVTLLRKRYSPTQKNLSRDKRLDNLKNSFYVVNNKYKDKNVVLFDDVYTTGATLYSCYNALLEVGYKNIESLTLYHD